MPITDIVLLLVLALFVGLGAKDGFIHTLGRLLGAIVGFMLAQSWSSWIAGMLTFVMPAGWARVIAFTVVFIVITRLLGLALKIVDGIFKILTIVPFLKSIDRLLGAIIGLGEAVIVLGGIIYLIKTFQPVPSLYALVNASSVAMKIGGIFHSLLGILLK